MSADFKWTTVVSLLSTGCTVGLLSALVMERLAQSRETKRGAASGANHTDGSLILEFKILSLKARVLGLQLRNRLLQLQNRRLRSLGAGLPTALTPSEGSGDQGDRAVEGSQNFTEVHGATSSAPRAERKREGGEA